MRSALLIARAVIALAILSAVSACGGTNAGRAKDPAPPPAPTDAAVFPGKKVVGRIAPDLIQKVVRANFDPLRTCYESGLKRNRDLQGRVAVKFVIDTEGRVVSAVDAGSDMPDREVIQCIVAEYRKLTFPKPEGGGIVTVIYPIVFNPAD